MDVLSKLLNWKAIVEILILWFVVYRIFLFLKGTRALYLLRGIVILVISFLVFQRLDFYILSWLLTKFFAFFLILVVIVFQPELREGLIRLGKRHFFPLGLGKEELEKTIKEIVLAVQAMSKKKIGALIAVKRDIGLTNIIETGVKINATVSSVLLENIFYPSAPLHDGGVIVEGDVIISAACLFPLSENTELERSIGMRHRAAVGISEHSDTISIVVSEETGFISMAINGQLTRNLSPEELLTILKGQLRREK